MDLDGAWVLVIYFGISWDSTMDLEVDLDQRMYSRSSWVNAIYLLLLMRIKNNLLVLIECKSRFKILTQTQSRFTQLMEIPSRFHLAMVQLSHKHIFNTYLSLFSSPIDSWSIWHQCNGEHQMEDQSSSGIQDLDVSWTWHASRCCLKGSEEHCSVHQLSYSKGNSGSKFSHPSSLTYRLCPTSWSVFSSVVVFLLQSHPASSSS